MEAFVSAKQMFAFWPVGTNQQMLLLTFPQADWHRALPSLSFPFSQELSCDSTGCLVETFCKSDRLVKWVQTLFKWFAWPNALHRELDISCRCFWRLMRPCRVWFVSRGAVHHELELCWVQCQSCCAQYFINFCMQWGQSRRCLAWGQGIHLESLQCMFVCVCRLLRIISNIQRA